MSIELSTRSYHTGAMRGTQERSDKLYEAWLEGCPIEGKSYYGKWVPSPYPDFRFPDRLRLKMIVKEI